MSVEKALNTKTIYIPLLDEGTDVMRPAHGVQVGDNLYRVLATPNYDPEDERWKFPPGSIVRCIEGENQGERILIADTLELKGSK